MHKKAAILAILLLPLFGCGNSTTDPTGIATIRSTTSFGFCVGYCATRLEITSEQALFVKQDLRGTLPDVRQTLPISAAEWNQLIEAVDRERLGALPPVVGCPDCADGGAESLEVVGSGWREEVSFEHGARLEQAQPLLDRVRAIRSRFDS